MKASGCAFGSSTASDTNHFPMLCGTEASLGPHFVLFGLVCQVQAELGVQVGLTVGVGVRDRLDEIGEPVDECGDLGFAHLLLPWSVLPLRSRGVALLLSLGDPSGDDRRVSAFVQSFESGSVPRDLAVALGDGLLCQIGGGVLGRFGAGDGREGRDGLGAPVRSEVLAQPGIQRPEKCGFAQVDVPWVLDTVGQGVFLGEPAPVVGLVVVPGAFHPPVADSAVQGDPAVLATGRVGPPVLSAY
ncbi:hypothetical protein [Actinoallomurus sp. NPDC052274]|uniref:hypothetical protein n=1 Tax=Actinoallomurus sp. NPDC052274 TaxID=3155420 RepID=UPI00342F562B